jgi:N-methylhydantoinase A
MKTVRIGADIGGTFTDIVLAQNDGKVLTAKVSTTPAAPEQAVITGIADILARAGLTGSNVAEVVHGTTIGSNTLLEKTGAATGLITTSGFRDVLEIGRVRTPNMFDLSWNKPDPLIERYARLEVRGRIAADGTIIEPLVERDVVDAGKRFVELGISAVAICFINSYRNGAHERQARDILQAKFPDLLVSISTDLQPEAKEYERTSTTAVNAFVLAAMRNYLTRLADGLRGAGIDAPIYVVNSTGGLAPSALAAEKPVFFISSGPAAGVVGAARLGSEIAKPNLIAFDMGGTTAKAALIQDGRISLTNEYEFRAGISAPSRFIKAGGYLMRAPSVDIAEVGAGAGSIAWVDEGGLIHVGPRSAGANPGPACYDIGGTKPTVTDANVVLGYLNASALAGGSLRLNKDKAAAAIEEELAKPLRTSVREAAIGIREIVNANMARAIRAVTIERGEDPRDFHLIAFGGSGPVHACDLASMLGIRHIVIPNLAGVFTAAGMLAGDVERQFVQPLAGLLDQETAPEVASAFAALENSAKADLAAAAGDSPAIETKHFIDLRFENQDTELSIPLDGLGKEFVGELRERFLAEYERVYEYRATDRVELVAARVIATVNRSDRLDLQKYAAEDSASSPNRPSSRKIMFSRETGWRDCPIIARNSIRSSMSGPLIVESSDTTIVVPPNAIVSMDGAGNLYVELEDSK